MVDQATVGVLRGGVVVSIAFFVSATENEYLRLLRMLSRSDYTKAPGLGGFERNISTRSGLHGYDIYRYQKVVQSSTPTTGPLVLVIDYTYFIT